MLTEPENDSFAFMTHIWIMYDNDKVMLAWLQCGWMFKFIPFYTRFLRRDGYK